MKKRLNVMIDENLIKKIDEHAKRLGQSRSAFLSMSAATYINQISVSPLVPTLMNELKKIPKIKRI